MHETPATFTIASWNLHLGLHNDGGRNDVIARCRDLDCDVLVLQEAWWYDEYESTPLDDLVSELGYQLHHYVSDTIHRGRRFGVALMTRLPSRRLDDHVVAPGGRQPIHAMVRAELESFGVTIAGAHLSGIHLLWRNPAGWIRERAALSDAARSNDLVVGDMNMWGPVVARDAHRLRRAVFGRTWPSHRPHSQIDHILVSDRLEVLDAEVMADMGSDHRAIRAVLKVR